MNKLNTCFKILLIIALVTVTASASPQTVSVVVHGGGDVQVFKNQGYMDTVTTTGSFQFDTSDQIGLVPRPNAGWRLQGLCDVFECITGSYWGGLYQGLSIYTVTATFVPISVTPTPTTPPPDVWSVDVSVSNDLVQIGACIGSGGGYYKLKSASNTILRSNFLESNMCRSYTESKSYLYSIEHGNWIAYATDTSGTIKAFKSFSVDPIVTPTTPPPTSSPTPPWTPPPTPPPTYTPPPTPTPTNTPIPPCPDGLSWDGTQCVVEPPPSDNIWLVWAAGIIGLGTVVYFTIRKPKKGNK
ncbi:MAG: hypothetical protein WC623_21655 [Pedobacter sp.]|uniref:hypothetical protein n=1 Tax=Pedobacter sp. TaxID=1411316 RepID=UPI00356A5F8B